MVVGAAVLFLTRLGATDLWAPDEPRYGQIAAELHSMRHGPGGLVLLHLNGEPYTQKPPLYYWLAALAGTAAGGVTELAARLPSALAGVALVALVAAFGARLLGPATGVFGAAFLATAYEFVNRARRVQLDVLLALLETVALVAFWRLDRGVGSARANVAALHGFMGLAVLTKGPVGLLVPALVIAVWLVWEGRPREIARAFPPWAFLLSVGPGLVWVAGAVALAPPGFFSEAVGENVFGRFFAGTSHARPFYYYLTELPVDLLPWTLPGVVAAWFGGRTVFSPGTDAETRRGWRFLLAWLGASLLFFSLSSGKRGLYLIPAFPAATLLFADGLVRWVGTETRFPPTLHGIAALLGAVLAGAGAWVALTDPLHQPGVSRLGGVLVMAAVAIATAAWLVLGRARRPGLARLGTAVAAVFAMELVIFGVLFPARNPEKSPRPIAEAAAQLLAPEEPIGLVGQRALAGGLVYYGGRPVRGLSGPESIARFLAEGGRVFVVRERHLDRLEAVTPVEVRHRSRRGRRAIVVVTPRSDSERSERGERPSPRAFVGDGLG